MIRRTASILWLCAGLAAGCGGGAAPGEGWAELGTGEWEFVPIEDGQDVPLVAGSQGGHHVWASLRTEGLDPDRVMLEIETQPADGSMPPEVSRVPVPFEPMEAGGARLLGWPAVLSEPGCVVDRMLRVTVTLTDEHGVRAGDERFVVPRAPTAGPPLPCGG